MDTLHLRLDRQERESLIEQHIGKGVEFTRFTVDKGHRNGPEIHIITTTALIIVLNKRTQKHVTTLIARPGQIKRYYKDGKAPKFLIRLAREHQLKGWNNW